MLSSNEVEEITDEEEARLKRLERDEMKRKMEATLYLTREPVHLDELRSLFPDKRKNEVLDLIRELKEDYALEDAGIHRILTTRRNQKKDLCPSRTVIHGIQKHKDPQGIKLPLRRE